VTERDFRADLGYPFTPTPRRLWTDVRDGVLTIDQYPVVAYLFERANIKILIRRGQTPTLTLDEIARGVRWKAKLDSLRRLLARLRATGRYFDYVVSGNSRTTQVYVFTLRPEAPEPEALMEAVCPPVELTETRADTCNATTPERAVSARSLPSAQRPPVRPVPSPPVNPAKTGATTSESDTRTTSVSVRSTPSTNGSCPPGHTACPPVNEPANPRHEPSSASPPSPPVRPAQRTQRTATDSVTSNRNVLGW
jgi:hypothetical protein